MKAFSLQILNKNFLFWMAYYLDYYTDFSHLWFMFFQKKKKGSREASPAAFRDSVLTSLIV